MAVVADLQLVTMYTSSITFMYTEVSLRQYSYTVHDANTTMLHSNLLAIQRDNSSVRVE